MKKLLIAITLLLLLIAGVFYQQILATIDFYQYQHDNADTFDRATLTWKQIPFTSTGRTSLSTDSLSFDTLLLPIPHGMTKQTGQDAAMAVGYSELITVTHSSVAADFFRMYNFSETEKTTTCAFLTKTSGDDACSSDHTFYGAFLELNKTDIHAFAPTEDKELYNRLLTIRADLVPATTVSGFASSHLQGFLFKRDGQEYVAEVFDAQDRQYKLEFSGLDQAEVAFILSNTTSR